MNKKIILFVALMIMIGTLTSCKNNEEKAEIPNIRDSIIIKDSQTKEDIKGQVYNDNNDHTINIAKQYDSGIYIEDVEIAKEYNYKGKDIKPLEIEIEHKEIEDIAYEKYDETNEKINNKLKEIENKLKEYQEKIENHLGNLSDTEIKEINQNIERLQIQKEAIQKVIEGIAEDKLKNDYENKLKYLEDLKDYLKNRVYNSGINQILGYDNKEYFNENNQMQIITKINIIKNELESINYYDDIINKNFTEYENVINNWNKIKNYLYKWQLKLNKIETDKDYKNTNFSKDDNEEKDLENCLSSIDSVIASIQEVLLNVHQ